MSEADVVIQKTMFSLDEETNALINAIAKDMAKVKKTRHNRSDVIRELVATFDFDAWVAARFGSQSDRSAV